MKLRIVLAALLLLAAAAGWLAWRLTSAGVGLASSAIIEAPNGHAYRYIAAPDISWREARDAAERQFWKGRRGYLATIDNADEYRFVVDRLFPTTYPDV